MDKFTCLALWLLCFNVAWVNADETLPARLPKNPIALVGGTVHPVSGPAVTDATILLDQGKIVAIGQKLEIPADAEIIEISGKHVYPGMFEPHTQLGLTEISSIRASIDSSEVGAVNPNVKAAVALNPDSSLLPVTRANGVLLALSAPTGGLISGQAAVIQLEGWTYEDLTINAEAAMVINWPGGGGGRRRGGRETSSSTTDPLQGLKELLDQARAYDALKTANADRLPVDLALEALVKVVRGDVPILASANDQSQIESAVAFCAKEKLRLIILGGYDAEACAELLKRHDVPVVITAIHRVPQNRSDTYDAAYTLPARLQAAGVRFCISGSGRSETWNSRNLPYHAATAVAFGLDPEIAMRSITLSPAEIFRVSDRVGSLEVGKDATLFVCDGNPLEITSQVEKAFIQGRPLDLSSKHTRLRDKYLEKYDALKDGQ